MVDKSVCIGCGSCLGMCPVGALKFDENYKATIDKSICIGCGACEAICPVGAINITN